MRLSDQFETINKFRRRIPVDVEALSAAIGVDVHYAFLHPEISGMLERLNENGDYRITINAADPLTRQRFTLAHELGHYMLHRPLVGAGVDDDRAYRSTQSGLYHNTLIGPKEETEANRFAANVLMPYDMIERVQEERNIREPSEIARIFGVSRHAMSIRMGVPYEG